MNISGERDRVIVHDVGIVPEVAVSAPVVLQSEFSAFLVFGAVRVFRDGKRGETGIGIVEVVRCSLTKFGHPNDGALIGHPLAGGGLRPNAAFEVVSSSWIRDKTEQERIAFPRTPDSKQRHFIVTFHDSTFECIADDLLVTLSAEPFEQIFRRISVKVLRDKAPHWMPGTSDGVPDPAHVPPPGAD